MKTITKFLPLFLITGLLFAGGCKLVNISKDINGGSVTFTLTTQSKGTYDEMADVTIDIKEELKKYSVDISKLKKLYIKSAKFTIIDLSASPVNFNIVDNAILEIGSTSAALPMKKLAWKDPVPHSGASSIDADVDGTVDLIPYANAGAVQYHVHGTLNTDLDHEIDLKSEFTWVVEF
jgi:hypothetical protein